MASSYIIVEEVTLTRQEGDTGELAFIVPEVLDPSLFTITLQVRTVPGENEVVGRLVLEKTGDDWTVEGQNISAPLEEADTKYWAGTHRWEMQFTDVQQVITVGKGDFIITGEIIP
jgi:hypothetical protein